MTSHSKHLIIKINFAQLKKIVLATSDCWILVYCNYAVLTREEHFLHIAAKYEPWFEQLANCEEP